MLTYLETSEILSFLGQFREELASKDAEIIRLRSKFARALETLKTVELLFHGENLRENQGMSTHQLLEETLLKLDKDK